MRWVLLPRPEIGRVRFPYQYVPLEPAPAERTPLTFKERRKLSGEVAAWCRQEFGPEWRGTSGEHLWRWHRNGTEFGFRYEQDAFMFKMRWG